MQCSAVKYRAVQFSVVQCSEVYCGAVQRQVVSGDRPLDAELNLEVN